MFYTILLPSRLFPKQWVQFLTLLQLETHFWGQNYLDLVWGGVRGL